jgi:hypothetical protein
MFEDWPSEFDRPCRTELARPRPVTIDLAQMLAPQRYRPASLPMRVRAGGLVLSGNADGMLLAWARTSQGAWLGYVELTVTIANGHGMIGLRQWVSSGALRPR